MMEAEVTRAVYNHGFLKRSLPADSYQAAMLLLKAQMYNDGFRPKKICKATSHGTKVTWVAFRDDDDRKAMLKELEEGNKAYRLKYGTNVLDFKDQEEEDQDEA